LTPGASAALIEIVHCDGRRETFALRPGNHTVGRADSDLTLRGDRNLSRSHARLEVSHKLVRVHDLGSSCGTFEPNGERITSPHSMRKGDWVVLGRTELHVLALAELVAVAESAAAMTQPELELELGEARTVVLE
jgi:pSer/pThr/pTyr-binding forkhead associated (FHA) protein